MMISTQQIAVLLSLFISVQGSLWQQPLEEGNTLECPSLDSIPDFDLEKFLGDWYVLQYQYPNEKKLKDLSCIGFHFAKNAFSADIVSNFTFRFPATTGHFYHIPTFSEIVNGNKAVWKTQIKGVEMISGILDTDYSKWAILTQCKVTPSGSTFLSTRLLSRSRYLSSVERNEIQGIANSLEVSTPFKYDIKQDVCQEIDGVHST
ncbi:uncharacterized protein [Lepeophtheirus salmonis]|uniref:Lipocalin/cytosolic fatty-acid binding domain-containing protein n=1 Tax=Lepeophtheirus salmonis TaxID=72036 RepID=A0A0K2TDD9_LEPSM|nr:uncharacterized protein LOC121123380 [Lepeophtheirus salmonis]